MAAVRAVLFDFGGTLYDYATLEAAERESLVELARWAGIDAEPARHPTRAPRRHAPRVPLLPAATILPAPRPLPRRGRRHAGGSSAHRSTTRRSIAIGPRSGNATRATSPCAKACTDTLNALRLRGLHLGIVSNIDDDQLAHLLELADDRPVLRLDPVERTGPSRASRTRRIFEEALRRAGCASEEALFVGDTLAQDIAGANQVGLQSVLLWHRQDRDPPAQEPRPRHVIRRIPDLLGLLE